MVVHQTEASEETEVVRKMNCRNVMVKTASPMKQSNAALLLLKIIFHFFQKLHSSKTFPKSFKTSKVIPQHKKAIKQMQLNNDQNAFWVHSWRSSRNFCKNVWSKHAKHKNIQYGFREKMSCIDAFNSVTEFMRNGIEGKNKDKFALLIQRKLKLEYYGSGGTFLEKVRKYSNDRY